MKIFNFGLPRTGTTSFHRFLISNDIHSLHSNRGEIKKIYPNEYIKYLNDEPSLIDEYIEEYEAFNDLPWYSLAKKIIEKHHKDTDIYYVCTFRPSIHRWHKSIKTIINDFRSSAIQYHRYVYGNHLNDLHDLTYAQNIYKNHYINLQNLAKKYDINIHVVDFNDTNSIIKILEESMGLKLYNKIYPHVNKS